MLTNVCILVTPFSCVNCAQDVVHDQLTSFVAVDLAAIYIIETHENRQADHKPRILMESSEHSVQWQGKIVVNKISFVCDSNICGL